MGRLRVALAAAAFACAAVACVRPHQSTGAARPHPPADLLGEFADDYGNRYTIDHALWTQQPHGRFHIIRWDSAGQYLLARNDSANKHAPGRYTRIDWVRLSNMSPYDWAFCLSAYEAVSLAAAETSSVARRDTPRTGCNGYPFSRMRRM